MRVLDKHGKRVIHVHAKDVRQDVLSGLARDDESFLDAVLKGAEALKRTSYYDEWPERQLDIVVSRRARMFRRYGRAGEEERSQEH